MTARMILHRLPRDRLSDLSCVAHFRIATERVSSIPGARLFALSFSKI